MIVFWQYYPKRGEKMVEYVLDMRISKSPHDSSEEIKIKVRALMATILELMCSVLLMCVCVVALDFQWSY